MSVLLPSAPVPLSLTAPLPPLGVERVSWPWGGTPSLTKWSLAQLKYPLGTIIRDIVDGYPVIAQIQTHDTYGAHPDWPATLHKGTSVFVPAVRNDAGRLTPLSTPPDRWLDAPGFGAESSSMDIFTAQKELAGAIGSHGYAPWRETRDFQVAFNASAIPAATGILPLRVDGIYGPKTTRAIQQVILYASERTGQPSSISGELLSTLGALGGAAYLTEAIPKFYRDVRDYLKSTASISGERNPPMFFGAHRYFDRNLERDRRHRGLGWAQPDEAQLYRRSIQRRDAGGIHSLIASTEGVGNYDTGEWLRRHLQAWQKPQPPAVSQHHHHWLHKRGIPNVPPPPQDGSSGFSPDATSGGAGGAPPDSSSDGDGSSMGWERGRHERNQWGRPRNWRGLQRPGDPWTHPQPPGIGLSGPMMQPPPPPPPSFGCEEGDPNGSDFGAVRPPPPEVRPPSPHVRPPAPLGVHRPAPPVLSGRSFGVRPAAPVLGGFRGGYGGGYGGGYRPTSLGWGGFHPGYGWGHGLGRGWGGQEAQAPLPPTDLGPSGNTYVVRDGSGSYLGRVQGGDIHAAGARAQGFWPGVRLDIKGPFVGTEDTASASGSSSAPASEGILDSAVSAASGALSSAADAVTGAASSALDAVTGGGGDDVGMDAFGGRSGSHRGGGRRSRHHWRKHWQPPPPQDPGPVDDGSGSGSGDDGSSVSGDEFAGRGGGFGFRGGGFRGPHEWRRGWGWGGGWYGGGDVLDASNPLNSDAYAAPISDSPSVGWDPFSSVEGVFERAERWVIDVLPHPSRWFPHHGRRHHFGAHTAPSDATARAAIAAAKTPAPSPEVAVHTPVNAPPPAPEAQHGSIGFELAELHNWSVGKGSSSSQDEEASDMGFELGELHAWSIGRTPGEISSEFGDEIDVSSVTADPEIFRRKAALLLHLASAGDERAIKAIGVAHTEGGALWTMIKRFANENPDLKKAVQGSISFGYEGLAHYGGVGVRYNYGRTGFGFERGGGRQRSNVREAWAPSGIDDGASFEGDMVIRPRYRRGMSL